MYNIQVFHYYGGVQVRLYNRPVASPDDIFSGRDIDFDTGEVESREFGNEVFNPFTGEREVMSVLPDEERSLRVSFARTRNNIFYLARSNCWEYFLTLTIDGAKKERYDYDLTSKWVRKWFENTKKRKAPNLYYLIVPEQHEDGAWHFHGLIGGTDGLTFVDGGRRTIDGEIIYNLSDWRYGWTTATKINDTGRASSYIGKYVTKDLCSITKGKKRYWCSTNCNRAASDNLFVGGVDLKDVKKYLYENMTWKKRVDSEYLSVEYFELPCQEELLELIRCFKSDDVSSLNYAIDTEI